MCLLYVCLFLVSLPAICHGQCRFNTTTLTVPNGYISNAASLTTTHLGINIAYGYLEYACAPGYTLNPIAGSRLTCYSNGSWSTHPVCQSTGRCPTAPLYTFVQNPSISATMTFNGNSSLPVDGYDTSNVISGAFVPMICSDGYVNAGGPLNITCVGASWTPFPNCVWISGDRPVATTTATIALNTGSPCIVESTTVDVANGYIINGSKPGLPIGTTFPGWLLYKCSADYTIDPAIGALYNCNNGFWSTKPRCLRTSRCSLSTLATLLSTTTGLQSTGLTQLMQMPDESTLVLSDSYAVFNCMSGYTNIGGSLNVTCNADGSWSRFPNCVIGTQTTITPSTGGSSCPYSSSLLTITNGYASSWNGVMISIPDQALRGSFIDYTCMPSYTLMGNSRITCTNGVWSAQPVCIASGPGGMTTTTSTTTVLSLLRCIGIPSVANAYISNATLVNFGNDNYQGQVHFTCRPGYVHVATSGRRWVSCTNGVWDAFPVCTESPVCSIPELQAALVNVAVGSHSLSKGPDGGVLAGGWIQLQCAPGFTLNPFSGSLDVTCQSTGRWTQFPVCSR